MVANDRRLLLEGNASFTSPTARNRMFEAVIQLCRYTLPCYNCEFFQSISDVITVILWSLSARVLLEKTMFIFQFSLVVYFFVCCNLEFIAVYCTPLVIPVV